MRPTPAEGGPERIPHSVISPHSPCRILLIISCALAFALVGGATRSAAEGNGPPGLALVGRVVDPQGEPVEGATVALFLGEEQAPLVEKQTQADGTFVLAIPSPDPETIRLEVRRPHFQSVERTLAPEVLRNLQQGEALRLPEIRLQRRISAGFWVATGTFLGILLLIALGTLHNAMAALLGAAVVLGVSLMGRPLSEDLFIFSFEQALSYVDFNVIFLVMGMMIVIGIIEETGIFQWTAYQAYRLSRGRAWLLAIILMAVTSVASALLDNVTTMLLMAPITLQIALALGIDPLSLLLPEVLASNVGGISTLIGTPTNILVGSYAHIGFNDFLINLTPGVVLALVVLTGYALAVYWKEYRKAGSRLSPVLLARLRENARITEPVLLCKVGVVFAGMLVLFVLGERLHLPPAVTAILGAVTALLWAKPDIEEMLQVVDWTTLIFFIALFIVIGAIEEVGLISMVALGLQHIMGQNLDLAMATLAGSAALASGVVDNIPFAAAMLPVAGYLTRQIPGAGSKALFYSLSVGAAMGGNSTLIGASANLVTAGIAERAGYPIRYLTFLKVGFPATLLTVATGMLWLLVRF